MPDLSLAAQRVRLLACLRARGARGCTTIHAREMLDIIAPAARVFELRHLHGWNIQTLWVTAVNAQGKTHRVARYVLMAGKWKGVQL